MKKSSLLVSIIFLFTFTLFGQNILQNFPGSSNSDQNNKNSTNFDCDILWKDAIHGGCIGESNNFLNFDVDNDGTQEIIVNAMEGYSNSDIFGFWYILKYNPANDNYEKFYVSEVYDNKITKLAMIDLNSDGTNELVFSVRNKLYIFDLTTYSILDTIVLPELDGFYDQVDEIQLADIDGDGEQELLTSAEDWLIIINTTTFEIEYEYQLIGGNFDIGNVDTDNSLELVFCHGRVLEIDANGNFTEDYDFNPEHNNSGGYIRLLDITNDNIDEAIMQGYYIYVWDVVNASLYQTIESDNGIDAITFYDYDNDGLVEIIYGEDDVVASVRCVDIFTGEEFFQIESVGYGVSSLLVGDFDSDEQDELIFSSNCNSTAGDHIFIYGINSDIGLAEEWGSPDRDGPFYVVEIIDVDEELEIITVSRKSDSGYDPGMITIFDAVSKEIEFESTNVFDSDAITFSIKDIAFYDYLNDGDLDILIVGRHLNKKIWIIDGDTYEIEFEYTFDNIPDVSQFDYIEVVDIESDGVNCCIKYNTICHQ